MTIDATNRCDFLTRALAFRNAGFAVHWLKERSKAPAGGDKWQDAPIADADRLRETYRDGMNLGLRTGEPSKVAGLYAHVFDIDIRFDDLADEAWEAFDRMLPGIRDKLPCVVSGSGGESRHLHFLTDKPFYGRKLAVSDAKHRTANGGPTYNWEIDLFGTGRQVAMPPSIHPSTGIAYRWEREYDLDGLEFGGGPIIDSAVIEALGIASTSAFEFETKPPFNFQPGQLEADLDILPVDLWDDRPKWIMLGQALHHQFGGSQEGFDLWMHYSAKSKSHLKDSSLRAELRRYRGFGRNRREPVTMGTVRKWARAERMIAELPDLDSDQDIDEFDALLVACSPGDEAVFSIGLDDDGGAAAIRRLNRRHAVVSHNGRALIVTEDESAIHFGTANDLHTFYENDRRAKPGTKDTNRPDQTEPVSKYWMRHRDRRTCPNGVTFAPGRAAPGAINLWRDWAVKPKAAASCEHIVNHVREVICRGDEDHAAYLFGWMAHLVQRPADKPGVAIVLRGGKGAGKDTLGDYLAAMMGRYHAPTVSQDKHITGNFNRRLESALLLHVQEGTWAGDHRAEGVLKYLVTSEWIEIERKGIDIFQLPSFLRLFISSNADWTVPASADERRWAVFNVSDARQGDAAYFRAIRDEMAGDGPAALLAWQQAYDLTGFNVRAAPETAGLLEQKLASLRGIERWWYDVLSAGELRTHNATGEDWASGACKTPRTELREEYAKWLRDQKFEGNPLGDRQFGAKLREMVTALHDRRGGSGALRIREYVLPPLDVCREQFGEWVGGRVDWEG